MAVSRISVCALILIFLVSRAAPAWAQVRSPSELKAEAEELTAQYAAQLKGALAGAMTAGGALDICNKNAPEIARDLSSRRGWSVARTSLKPRNAASAPDHYERRIMEGFAARIAKGEDAASLVSAEIVEDNGATTFRFLKTIPTTRACLSCHGDGIKPDVKRKISQLYPDDRATGFNLGDMRGVFTLKKQLESSR